MLSNNNTQINTVNQELENLIPPEEQAVEVKATPQVVIVERGMAIPEGEEAVQTESGSTELELAQKAGCFSPVFGMGHIENVLGGKVYAAIHEDEEGNRRIEFCEDYGNSRFSPKIRISQADLIMATGCNFQPNEIPDRKLRNRVATFLTDIKIEYLGKFSGTKVLNIEDVLMILMETLSELPTNTAQTKELSAMKLYEEVLRHLPELGYIPQRKAYYPLTSDHIELLAEKIGMKKQKLLEQLKKHNFLYLTDASRGYETNVRFTLKDLMGPLKEDFFAGESSTTEWCYCIYKLEYLRKIRGESTT